MEKVIDNVVEVVRRKNMAKRIIILINKKKFRIF